MAVPFALMGSIYAERAMDTDRRGSALLSTEKKKAKETNDQTGGWTAGQSPLHFVGNVEPKEMLAGQADVVVTDGFAGNITIKIVGGHGRLCSSISSRMS
jgi:glycerol-3-phosphate acyltransferase PlsX